LRLLVQSRLSQEGGEVRPKEEEKGSDARPPQPVDLHRAGLRVHRAAAVTDPERGRLLHDQAARIAAEADRLLEEEGDRVDLHTGAARVLQHSRPRLSSRLTVNWVTGRYCGLSKS